MIHHPMNTPWLQRMICTITVMLILQGCSALATFESKTPGATLQLRGRAPMPLPVQLQLDSKATGQHEFKVTAPSGQSMYGILPLHVQGGRMAASITLFAPALALGGFRDPYPNYEFDLDAGVLRYKVSDESEEWRLYKPTRAESDRAKTMFDRQSK